MLYHRITKDNSLCVGLHSLVPSQPFDDSDISCLFLGVEKKRNSAGNQEGPVQEISSCR